VQEATTSRTLQLRETPHVFLGYSGAVAFREDPVAETALQRAYRILQTNWRYSAATQLLFNGSEPGWSQNGWSFVPVNLSSSSQLAARILSQVENRAELGDAKFNATVETPAIRAGLECTSISSVDDLRLWSTEHDLTNSTIWNNTKQLFGHERGWTLGCKSAKNDLFFSPSLRQFVLVANETGTEPCSAETYTSFFSNQKTIACCADTDSEGNIGNISVGYWSPVFVQDLKFPKYSDTWPANLTVKWIQGHAIGTTAELTDWDVARASGIDGLVWTEPPRVTALNCRPVMETTRARITLDVASAHVYSYEILRNPTPDRLGWMDVAVHRNKTNQATDGTGLNEDGQFTTSIPTNITMR
jgi:hypothetical protein